MRPSYLEGPRREEPKVHTSINKWILPVAMAISFTLLLVFLASWMTHELREATVELRSASEELKKEREASAEQATRQNAVARDLLGKLVAKETKP